MLCDLALISTDSQIERRSSEAGRSVRGCNEWLAGHLTVGYQRDNNVWRQAGVVYVLQKNNCYPFKSHFLIGLAVVEGNLERRQVRERLRIRLRERVSRGHGERSTKVSCPQLIVCMHVYVRGGGAGVAKPSLPSLHLCCPGSSSHGAVLQPGDISHTHTQGHCNTHRLNASRLTAAEM